MSKNMQNPFAPSQKRPEPVKDTQYRRTEFLITEIREWLDSGDGSFDESFFESVESQFQERGQLSQKQLQALENIYDGTVNRY